MSASTIAWLAYRDPGLLAERYRMPGTGGQSRRDRRIIYLVMVGFVAWIALRPGGVVSAGVVNVLSLDVPRFPDASRLSTR